MKEFGFGVSIAFSDNFIRCFESFYILDINIGISFTESDAYLWIKGMESTGMRFWTFL